MYRISLYTIVEYNMYSIGRYKEDGSAFFDFNLKHASELGCTILHIGTSTWSTYIT